jgi:hypothetical protein
LEIVTGVVPGKSSDDGEQAVRAIFKEYPERRTFVEEGY